MGPAPMTKTFSPGSSCARRTACAPIVSISTRANWSSESVRDRCSLPTGTAMNSRIPPSVCTPSTCSATQQLVFPRRQAMHRPQCRYGSTAQRSPTARPVSFGPTATISTPSSCPTTRGYVKKGWFPLKAWMSLPQTPTRWMRTSAWPGAGSPGLGRSVNWKLPGFSSTIVFMAVSVLPGRTNTYDPRTTRIGRSRAGRATGMIQGLRG